MTCLNVSVDEAFSLLLGTNSPITLSPAHIQSGLPLLAQPPNQAKAPGYPTSFSLQGRSGSEVAWLAILTSVGRSKRGLVSCFERLMNVLISPKYPRVAPSLPQEIPLHLFLFLMILILASHHRNVLLVFHPVTSPGMTDRKVPSASQALNQALTLCKAQG